MLNKVMLIGRLGADPETRYMPSGDAVTSIRMATDRTWKDRQTGERKQETEWHRVVFFNQGNYKLAEIAGEYLKKGSLLYVEGRIRTQKWQDKNGQDRYTTEILAETMHMLESKGGGTASYNDNVPPVSIYENQTPAPRPATSNAPPPPVTSAPASAPPGNYDDFDDDIPF